LALRAALPADAQDEKSDAQDRARWRTCIPDVFSIRNTSVPAYLEPIVHEIKVARADLLGDLKNKDKRNAYLELGGQCWYVLGCNAKGRPIGEADEIPTECGVMVYSEGRFNVVRTAPKRPAPQLPFAVWMALAKASPMRDGGYDVGSPFVDPEFNPAGG
jgi:hypothetical protein